MRSLFLLAALVVVAAAAAQPAPRHADGLLDHPGLQRVADVVIRRDGGALARYLNHSDPLFRARAAFGLASVQDSAATPALLALLSDPEPLVRADVAFALGQQAGRVPSEPLLSALQREHERSVRVLLLEALGKQGDVESLGHIAVSTWPAAERAEAALSFGRYALRSLHDSRAVSLLISWLRDFDARTRLNAAYYFGRSRETEVWAARADEVRAALDGFSPEDPAAMHLLIGLARLSDPQDDARFLRFLQASSDWRVRLSAVRALDALEETSGIEEALLASLADPSPHVAEAAAGVLAQTPTPARRARFLEHQQPETADWRLLTAAAPLFLEPTSSFDLLGYVRQHAPPQAAARVLSTLGTFQGERGLEVLFEAATDADPHLANAALSALSNRWRRERLARSDASRFYDAFRAGLRRHDAAMTSTAASALSDSIFVALGSVALLAETYATLRAPQDYDAMGAVLGALGASRSGEARPLLEAAREAGHPGVRAAAARALAVLDGTPPPPPPSPSAPERTIDWAQLTLLGPRPTMIIETDYGVIRIRLDAEQAPLTVQTMAEFANAGRFDGVPFHRVVPNFVVQGGDFERGDGYGGPDFSIRSEFTRLHFEQGVIGMASSGKDTEGSQYFLMHSAHPHLDGRYTAFGRLVEGAGTMDRLQEADVARRVRVLAE